MKRLPMIEPRTVAVLAALAVGFGIAVHPFFFVVGLMIVLLPVMEWTTQKLGDYLHSFRRSYRRA